ncbi:MAG TPA: helix-turn-helix domain-containing protein, partial [Gemmatimonadales bacterium]|nr:helix-turn-helix domain-containing protein [Gemmatimonadales bacterium]
MSSHDEVAAVRRFNRFYTRQMGLLDDGLLHSPYSLTEVRVLYEIAHRTAPTASAIGQGLGLDPGYLSRLLQRLRKAGLVSATSAAGD